VKLAVVGAGWAGLAAAVYAVRAGHTVTVYEAAHNAGGRARSLMATLPDGSPAELDNGQHILIGAYTETLALMRSVGVNVDSGLLRQPLSLRFPDGNGLALPDWPSPLDALGGTLMARGWSLRDKLSLLRAVLGWQLRGFRCEPDCSVAQLCRGLSPQVWRTLIDPLCVSALNTPSTQASAQVFLRVLKDALFGVQGGSNLLLPTRGLSDLLPHAAVRWLQDHGAQLHFATQVQALHHDAGWHLMGQRHDAVIWATSSAVAARVLDASLDGLPAEMAQALQAWAAQAGALHHEAIATVWVYAPGVHLDVPMLALHSSQTAPAQFVFDRHWLGGPAGLLAFVVSASALEREALQQQVLAQACAQLPQLQRQPTPVVIKTIVEKRATFACTPGLKRPPMLAAPGLLVCGDYVEGPYPATVEGAVRSAQAAVASLGSAAS
jgi:hydroxysqualene dehydroxylase